MRIPSIFTPSLSPRKTRAVPRVHVGVSFGFWAILLCSLFFDAAPAFAKTVSLFYANGRQKKNYNALIASIEPGDTVVLGREPDETIVIEQDISGGDASRIWVDQRTGDAIRVPAMRGYLNARGYVKWFNSYIDAHRALQGTGVRLPEVIASKRGRYIRQRFIAGIRFDLYTLLYYPEKIEPELRQKAEVALESFARSTVNLVKVGDPGANNIVYTDEGWIFLDFATRVIRFQPGLPGQETLFDHMLYIKRKDARRLRAIVLKQRAANCFLSHLPVH